MYKYKLHIIMIIILISFIFGACSAQRPEIKTMAESGVMDLTRVKLENSVVRLDGQWEFFWNQLIAPGKAETKSSNEYIQIPSSWNKYKGNEDQSGYGYATYRLQFITAENIKLGLKIPRMFTAYKLWVNGELIAIAGKVGENREIMTPQYIPQLALFESSQGVNEILIQVSNFHHRSGGMPKSINLGGEKQIIKLRDKSLAAELIIFGSLIYIGAYHLALFLFRKKNTSSLYFGLFCLLVGMRTLLVGERFFMYLFPNFSWEIAHKLQTLSFYFGVPLILLFFMSIYPQYFHARIIKIGQIIGAIFGFLVVLTPARIFTPFNPIYQMWTVFTIIYIIVALIKIWIRKEDGSWFITIGALVLLMSGANDIIFLNIWMNDNGPAFLKALIRTGSLSSVGQLVFAFANSLLLSKRFSDSLAREEILTAELTEINSNLDELVSQRTKDLEKSKEKIEQQKLELEKINKNLNQLSFKDCLTGIWNRRKYDETIEIEWRRCLRYKRPIALILLDIDYFKQFNDLYGHMAGDECLIKIGDTLKKSLSRSSDMAARYGGEEFIVLLPDSGKEEAIKIATMLRINIESIKIPHEKSSVSNYVTVSIGVTSTIPNNKSSYDDLFKVVDRALYQAKDAGRNQIKYLSQ
ncbi:diguanylate cyclase (GGDEF)-like protein [Alkalibaculum bacchi]|uniref:Diguanylate cyclase (GGDEF)-like protein n=2 Tax=Alkalibaculum bacchi TaxID=645887 RepID=A0A366I5V5_9FIRM|nr:diguanylate cyclase [Alkalibaculum bacchi]RBP63873.1 diguanylate cyclase (GGDEF)-like protein [Alkalibaculum bacchi]